MTKRAEELSNVSIWHREILRGIRGNDHMLEIFCSIWDSGKDRSFFSRDIWEQSFLNDSSCIGNRFGGINITTRIDLRVTETETERDGEEEMSTVSRRASELFQ
jgi:hypothetical protein